MEAKWEITCFGTILTFHSPINAHYLPLIGTGPNLAIFAITSIVVFIFLFLIVLVSLIFNTYGLFVQQEDSTPCGFYFHVRKRTCIPIPPVGNQNSLYQRKLIFLLFQMKNVVHQATEEHIALRIITNYFSIIESSRHTNTSLISWPFEIQSNHFFCLITQTRLQ